MHNCKYRDHNILKSIQQRVIIARYINRADDIAEKTIQSLVEPRWKVFFSSVFFPPI